MSLAVIYSRALLGMSSPLIEVETYLSNGLPSFNIVGLADTEVKESRDRVRASILQSGFEFPLKKIIVNLAPAELPKESGRFDLPIAISILVASGQIKNENLSNYEIAGELALSGQIRPIRGSILMLQQSIKENRYFILPKDNAKYSKILNTDKELGAESLLQVASFLNGNTTLSTNFNNQLELATISNNLDLSDVKGQETAKYTLEIAASGGHSLLMVGPPGTGKSMLANRLPSIMPDLTSEELLENIALYSVLNPLSLEDIDNHNYFLKPFRSPHHSASMAAIIGGGSIPKSGEISLANNGILFLDELPEFNKNVLESLREPLESGQINISRASQNVCYPANFQLIAAMNPCPCGYLNHPSKECSCSNEQISRYQKKLSGPFLDRIDLIIEIPSLPKEDLLNNQKKEISSSIKDKIIESRNIQYQRQGKINSKLSVSELENVANISSIAKKVLTELIEKLNISARSYHRILRIARTIADLSQKKEVTKEQIYKSISLRRSIY